jgi:uncharacterized Zn finger protein (UPF0148 family)
VFSYAIHNYRVKIAWDERETEFNKVKNELSQVQSITSDEAWLTSTAAKVKAARAGVQATVLKEELQAKVAESSNIINSSSSNKTTAKTESTENIIDSSSSNDKDTNMVGSLINGLGGGRIL